LYHWYVEGWIFNNISKIQKPERYAKSYTILYHITHKAKEILFIETGALGGTLVHYIVEKEKPKEKFIELKQLTGEYNFVEKIGTDTHSIYIPILELDTTSIEFPV